MAQDRRGLTPQGEDFSAWYNELVVRAQLVDRLAHHGARHAVRRGQLGLGGQTVARDQRRAFDLAGEVGGEPVRQAVGDEPRCNGGLAWGGG